MSSDERRASDECGWPVPVVSVRLFASLREKVGERQVDIALPEGADVRALYEALGAQYPQVRPFLESVVCAVDEEYVTAAHTLREGDRVALIPPVSGGC